MVHYFSITVIYFSGLFWYVQMLTFFVAFYEIISDCSVDPLRLKPTPLVLDKHKQILYSNSRSHVITLKHNDEITIACPGNRLLSNGLPMGEDITATCNDNDEFVYSGDLVSFYSFRCQDIPQNAVRYTEKSCEEGGEEIEIGYHIASTNTFVRDIRICFDNINLSPIYSQYNLTSNINYRDGRVPRKFFEEDGFYSASTSLDQLYNRAFERRTINRLLDLDDSSDFYIKGNNDDRFINRGHLTAKGDFVYPFQQLATFHYVNSAPQWASFNGGNWNELEISLRDLAHSTSTNFKVSTGVYGISTLRNSKTDRQTDLFLHTVNGKYLMPIPKLFWKLIQNEDSGKGIVIVGVNNAYEVNVNDDVVCNDISDRVSWFNGKLKNQKRNIQLGYVYACSVEDFCRKTNVCPTYLTVQGVLW